MPDMRTRTEVEELLAELAAAGASARLARDDDAVDGVAATVVVTPRDTATCAAAMQVLARHDLAVVARGTATKLAWAVPPRRLDAVMDTAAMDQVIEHAAGDLVVHAQAGVRIDALQRLLAPAGQRLALDPLTEPGTEGSGTVGGLIATASDGPLRHSHGAVRDLLIGVTIVRADGRVAKAGGKVVKNVAGYDLGKLLAGSYGTLGIVTEAVFRLHPRPEIARWVVRTTPDVHEAIALAHTVVRSQTVPTAVELDRPDSGPAAVAVLVDGIGAGVEARAAAVADLVGGDVHDTAPPWWGRAPWPESGTALRMTSELTGLSALAAALGALPVPVDLRGSAGVGKVHVGIAADVAPDAVAAAVTDLRAQAGHWGGEVVVLRAPSAVRERVDCWGPVGALALMRRVKHEFDPDEALAPGRFVGGI